MQVFFTKRIGLQRLLKQGSFHLEPTRSALNHVRNHAAYFAMFALAHALQPTGSAIILLTHPPFTTYYLFHPLHIYSIQYWNIICHHRTVTNYLEECSQRTRLLLASHAHSCLCHWYLVNKSYDEQNVIVFCRLPRCFVNILSYATYPFSWFCQVHSL